MGRSFFDACPEEGSVGDPVKAVCFRLILRARAIDDARRFHAGQSGVVCGGSAKKDLPMAWSPARSHAV